MTTAFGGDSMGEGFPVDVGLAALAWGNCGAEPFGQGVERNLVRVEIDIPGVVTAADVTRLRCDDIAAIAADIETRSDPSGAVRDRAARVAKIEMFTAAAGKDAPGWRQGAVLGVEAL